MRHDHVQSLGRQATGDPHPGEILRSMDGDASCVGPAVHSPALRPPRHCLETGNMRNRGAWCKANGSGPRPSAGLLRTELVTALRSLTTDLPMVRNHPATGRLWKVGG